MTHREPIREPESPATERGRTTALHRGGTGYGDEDPDLVRSEGSKRHRSPASAQRRDSAAAMAPPDPEPAQENRAGAGLATPPQIGIEHPSVASPEPPSEE